MFIGDYVKFIIYISSALSQTHLTCTEKPKTPLPKIEIKFLASQSLRANTLERESD